MFLGSRGGVLTHEAASHGILIYTDPWPKPYDRKPGKMTFTTASGLLPAGIAVYVQRGLNGVLLEMRYLVRLQGFTSQSETRGSDPLLPAWEVAHRLKIQYIASKASISDY